MNYLIILLLWLMIYPAFTQWAFGRDMSDKYANGASDSLSSS